MRLCDSGVTRSESRPGERFADGKDVGFVDQQKITVGFVCTFPMNPPSSLLHVLHRVA